MGETVSIPLTAAALARPQVDVIVTVYDALEHVRDCLASLRQHDDGFALRVLVVNDGSGPETSDFLRETAASWPAIQLHQSQHNRGYTRAVNAGLRASTAPWVVILNSDTQVTDGWLSGMLRCAETNPSIGLVGPLSNAASWQSVPRLLDAEGRFALNELEPDLDANGMAELVRQASARRYPRVPVLNGFCILLRRDVIERVGFMDEDTFALGYGEENDYCMRAAGAGFELVVADDAFVFHAKSRSFGHQQRLQLTRRGEAALLAKHGPERIHALLRELRQNAELRLARRAVQQALAERRDSGALLDPLRLRVLFILDVQSASGGANSVLLEAAEMAKLGAPVRVAVPPRALGELLAIYHDVPDLPRLLLGVAPQRLPELSKDFDVVVATAYYTAEWLARIVAANPRVLPAYYVQDYEPWFLTEGSPEWRAASASYVRLPAALLFAKTQFLVRTVKEQHDAAVVKVEPSLDHGTYHPAEREAGAVRVTAMVRPQTPRRAAARTMRVLRELAHRHGASIEIHVFGCHASDTRFLALQTDFAFTNHGVLRRPEVARLLRQSDLFVDLSDYQAFGRTALEAMASGCVAVVPRLGGCDEFAIDGDNALVVDSSAEQACVERIGAWLGLPRERDAMRRAALAAAARFSVSGAALSELRAMGEAVAARRQAQPRELRGSLALADLTTATQGRLALGSALAGWSLPSVHRQWNLIELRRLPQPGSADVAVVGLQLRGARRGDWRELADWLGPWRASSGRFIAQVDLEPAGSPGEGPAQLDARTLAALRWLALVADALTVTSEATRRRLQAEGLSASVVPLALDPIVWRLGPAACRPAVDPASDAVVVGVLGSARKPELVRLVQSLKRAYGARVVVRTLEPFARVRRLGRRIRLPKSVAEGERVDWAFEHLRWDIALASSADELRLLELEALGAVVVRVDGDAAAAERQLATLIEDAPLRRSLAAQARSRLEAAQDSADASGAAASLLTRTLLAPPGEALPALPASLRGFASRLLRRRRNDALRSEEALEPLPTAKSRSRRKLDKLRRDPAAFVRDSSAYHGLRGTKRRLSVLLRRWRPR